MSQPHAQDLEGLVTGLQEEILDRVRNEYTPAVVDHWLHPRHLGAMERPDGHARIAGSCGDSTEIFLRVAAGRVTEASFLTDGCGTTTAAASMAVELVSGCTIEEAERITEQEILAALGGLPEESEHCASLAAIALQAALESLDEPGPR